MSAKEYHSLMAGVVPLVLVSLPVAALAQQRDTPDQQTPATAASGGLAEIIVTAQKRSENLQDVPIAVTALSSAQLAGANIDGQLTLPKITPNLNFTVSSTFVAAYIRGVGTQYANPGLEPSVSVYLDDLYVPRAAGGLFSFNDVERIEVLKGPQGTLYGRNATGGAIRIITHDPKPRFEAAASVTVGSFETRNIDGMLNVPIAEGVAARFAARHAEDKGYVRNLAGGGGLSGARRLMSKNEELYTAKLLIERGPLTFKLSGDYERKDDTDGEAFLNLFRGAPEQAAAVSVEDAPPGALPGAYGGRVGTGFYDAYANAPTLTHVKAWGVAARLDYDLGPATLSSITGYRSLKEYSCADLDGTDADFQAGCGRPFTRQFTEEIQLTSTQSGPLNYVLGLFYLHERTGYPYSISGPGIGLPSGFALLSTSKGLRTRSLAPYVQLDYELSDRITITGGARYTSEKKHLIQNIGYFGPIELETGIPAPGAARPTSAAPCVEGGPPLCEDGDRSIKFNQFTPKVTLSYKPAPRILLYATYSRGFKSGGFNLPAFGYVASVRPEVLEDFEVGWKIERGRVRWNGAIFHYRYTDLQYQTTDISTGGATTRNAASARVSGIESDVTWAATERFELGIGAGYIDAKYRQFRGDAYYLCNQLGNLNPEDEGEAAGIAAAIAACPRSPAYPEGIGLATVANQNLGGNRLANAPDFSGYARAQYSVPLGEAGDMQFSAIGNYRSKAYFDAANLFVDRSRFLLSAKVTWTSMDDHYYVSVYGENLTDKKYDLQVTTVPNGGWRTPAAPRKIFVQAGVKF